MNCQNVQRATLVAITLLWLAGCSHTASAPPSEVDLDQITFLSGWTQTGTVRFTGGEYREPAAPDSASELVVKITGDIVYGELNGSRSAAVVLVTHAGGSGTFFDLALLRVQSGMWVNTDVAELGDRVEVHSIAIEDNAIRVDLTAHGPDDPMCCPSLRQNRYFTVRDERLAERSVSAEPSTPSAIVGIVWKWERSRYNNDTESVPPNPEQYTLQLQSQGNISVRADCNRVGGVYRLQDQQISIDITHSTMAACPPDSLEQVFIKDLHAAAIYFIREGSLYIDLKYDSGTMKFQP